MAYKKLVLEDFGANAKIFSFEGDGIVSEYHIMIQAHSFEGLEKTEDFLLSTYYNGCTVSAKRIFAKKPEISPYAIGQEPLGEYPFAQWLYLKNCPDSHNGYLHIWNIGMCTQQGGPGRQTGALLDNYEARLRDKGLTIADNCVRTWFFIKNIDDNYKEMVEARKSYFEKTGLTPKTHYITSTGICGEPTVPSACVQMDAYAIDGLDKKQLRYLYAKTHLNPTYEYGVTFERGSRIDYGDRTHVFISGTASINNKGEVLHIGDVEAQTLRMWENVGKLLEEACSSFKDLAQIIVYIRNAGDYEKVSKMFEESFPQIPYVITLAPVCRPTWLIEMECIAVKAAKNPRFRNF